VCWTVGLSRRSVEHGVDLVAITSGGLVTGVSGVTSDGGAQLVG
jgi:hypothetical protein